MARPFTAAILSLGLIVAGGMIADAQQPKRDPGIPAAKSTQPSAARPQIAADAADGRQAIELTASERARMLDGMRLYLQAIQGIVDALAKNQLDGAAQYAHEAGAKMLQDAPMSIPLKAPLEFTALGLQTHEKFDVLADRARATSRGDVLTALADIMNNCTSCHSTYRVTGTP